MSEEEDESFPRNEWVRAITPTLAKDRVLTETYYMLLPTGAMMRTITHVIEVETEAHGQFARRRGFASSTSEALCFIPGDYTLKVKGNNKDVVVLVPKK